MKLSEYLENPYGKGSTVAPIGQLKRDLENQFQILQSKFHCQVYLYRKSAIFHVQVPSREEGDLTYDVVLEFPLGDLPKEANNLNDINLKLFSNCPSFIFTYANLFYHNKLLCPWLVSKYDAKVKRVDANVRNQFRVIGLERSIYLAMYYLKAKGLTRITTFTPLGRKITSYPAVASHIRSQEQMLQQTRLDKKKQKEGSGSPTAPSVTRPSKPKPRSSNGVVPSVKAIRGTKHIAHTKTTKRVKKMK